MRVEFFLVRYLPKILVFSKIANPDWKECRYPDSPNTLTFLNKAIGLNEISTHFL